MGPTEAKSIFNVQLQVQIEVLRAESEALREYPMNRAFQLKVRVIEKQISILMAKHDSSTKQVS